MQETGRSSGTIKKEKWETGKLARIESKEKGSILSKNQTDFFIQNFWKITEQMARCISG